MLRTFIKQTKPAVMLLIFCTLITGLIYPVLVAGVSHLFFPWQANGSLIKQQGRLVGSALIGQYFDSSAYFWGRPSATTPFPYNAENSSGSNMGPSNPQFLETVRNRITHLKQGQTGDNHLVPVDLVTASGSGLDPDISPSAALYQIERIAKARHCTEQELKQLINQVTKKRTFYILGEPRVNVLELNMALDARHTHEQ